MTKVPKWLCRLACWIGLHRMNPLSCYETGSGSIRIVLSCDRLCKSGRCFTSSHGPHWVEEWRCRFGRRRYVDRLVPVRLAARLEQLWRERSPQQQETQK